MQVKEVKGQLAKGPLLVCLWPHAGRFQLVGLQAAFETDISFGTQGRL